MAWVGACWGGLRYSIEANQRWEVNNNDAHLQRQTESVLVSFLSFNWKVVINMVDCPLVPNRALAWLISDYSEPRGHYCRFWATRGRTLKSSFYKQAFFHFSPLLSRITFLSFLAVSLILQQLLKLKHVFMWSLCNWLFFWASCPPPRVSMLI